MKSILQFELPQEATEFRHANNGSKYYSILWELLCNHIRNEIKYGTDENKIKVYKEIRQYLIDELADHNIDVLF